MIYVYIHLFDYLVVDLPTLRHYFVIYITELVGTLVCDNIDGPSHFMHTFF